MRPMSKMHSLIARWNTNSAEGILLHSVLKKIKRVYVRLFKRIKHFKETSA